MDKKTKEFSELLATLTPDDLDLIYETLKEYEQARGVDLARPREDPQTIE